MWVTNYTGCCTPRVKRVIEAILSGETDNPLNPNDKDVELTLDLGLISYNPDEGYVIANPLYEETLMRFLNMGYLQASPPPNSWRWQKADGSLDMDALLHEFQDFWQTNADIWEQNANYREAFPHLLLIAFLQRVTNGHGRVEREYAAGRGRMDIAVEFNGRWNIIEIKLRRHNRTYEWVKEQGLTQIRRYRDRFPKAESAWLVIFDRRPEAKNLDWSQRLKWEPAGDVTVVGC